MRVLLAEHDPRVSAVVEDALVSAGFDLAIARTAEVTARLLGIGGFDALLLDSEFPALPRQEVAATLCDSERPCSLLVISGVAGKGAGLGEFALRADDYVTKPFHPDVILTRLRTLPPRHLGGVDAILRFDDLELDQVHSVAYRKGMRLQLTPPEFELLRALMRLDGEPESVSYFSERVLGSADDPGNTQLEYHLSQLRKKCGCGLGQQSIRSDTAGGLRLIPVAFAG
jgi:DNA-binding response OmpR family regulator